MPEQRRMGRFAAIFFTAMMMANGPALAIPSPELIIGSASSLSQIGAVVAALFGGSALFAGMRRKLFGNAANTRAAGRTIMVLLCVSAALAGLSGWQYLSARNAEQSRLQATLMRPSLMPGQAVLDTSLRQISFSDQQSHPLGISTGDAEALLKDGNALFLDIRESGEAEMGTLPGARHVRYPDLPASGLDLKGRKVVLFCHNGNRSFETCERLAKIGIDCRFIRGGIEKWIVEQRAFTDPAVRGLSDLRALPDYPQSNTLIDTDRASGLIAGGATTIVDVRYPGEFAVAHLPGAINIPIRRLSSQDLRKTIQGLPGQPVMAACYDRRSCFSSQVLGLELTRAGYQFLGRYTLPWEYYPARPPKPHVAAWLAKQQRGPWQTGIDALAGLLTRLADVTGLVIAILLAAVISRIAVLPVALKAERDQIAMRANAGELKELKSRLKGDPARLASAIKAFYRRHGMTPGRNLLALAFLPLMMLTLSAINQTAVGRLAGFAWIANLAQPDPVFILPAAIALLGGIYLDMVFVKSPRQRLIAWGLAVPAIAIAVATLPAAGTLYLAISMALLLTQRLYITRRPAWLFAVPGTLRLLRDRHRLGNDVIPLTAPQRLEGCGNKAHRLAVMSHAGIDVPGGAVLNSRYLENLDRLAPGARKARLDVTFARLGMTRVAVRSSARGEDGGANSFAGVFDSVLDVTADDFADAVDTVEASFSCDRSSHYAGSAGDANILVQQMIDADYSGVLFTRDPAHPGAMLVELVPGTADGLVSGAVTPLNTRFGRGSLKSLDDTSCPIDLGPLLEIARRCEALFAAPQDIEWVYRAGRFQIVQSRDITANVAASDGVEAEEWRRLADLSGDGPDDEVILRQDEMSEVLPEPTPFSLALMQRLWAPGGSADLACRSLGLSYPRSDAVPNRLALAFGRLYTDQRAASAARVNLTRSAAVRLRKSPEQLSRSFHTGFLPAFNHRLEMLKATDFDRLPLERLIRETADLIDTFCTSTHVEAERINIATGFYMQDAEKHLRADGFNPAQWLALGGEPPHIAALRRALPLSGGRRANALLGAAGHRAVFEYELAEPRYAEIPETLEQLASSISRANPGKPQSTPTQARELPAGLWARVKTAREYQLLKETAKDTALREFQIIRDMMLAIGTRSHLGSRIFHLLPDELVLLGNPDEQTRLATLADSRMEHGKRLLALDSLPAVLTRRQIEAGPLRAAAQGGELSQGVLAGQRVAGTAAVFGRARIVTHAQDIDALSIGRSDILICKMVHPSWLAPLLASGGVVAEVGGWLSHMAIVAREHNVSMITGASGALNIPDGAYVRMMPDGRVEVLQTNAGDAPESLVALTG